MIIINFTIGNALSKLKTVVHYGLTVVVSVIVEFFSVSMEVEFDITVLFETVFAESAADFDLGLLFILGRMLLKPSLKPSAIVISL